MQPTRSGMIELIKNEVHESARKVRYYGYLARHLMRINNTLQFIGVISSFLALFSLIGGLETPTLVLLGSASATLTLCTLRNYADCSRRSSEISLQLAQLHFYWHDLWNEALANEECDSFTRFKQLYARQLSILHFVPLNLTLSPRLARRSQHVLHDYWTPALQAAPATRPNLSDHVSRGQPGRGRCSLLRPRTYGHALLQEIDRRSEEPLETAPQRVDEATCGGCPLPAVRAQELPPAGSPRCPHIDARLPLGRLPRGDLPVAEKCARSIALTHVSRHERRAGAGPAACK